MRPGDNGADPWDGSEPERPIDIEALRADDEFIESLMSGVIHKPTVVRPRGTDVDAELRSMLSAWVLDVRPETVTAVEAAPVPAPAALVSPSAPDHDPASDTVVTGRGFGRNRAPVWYARRALVAASLVAVVSSGLALGAYQSEPGGALWPMTKVLYAEHARSVQAAADVTIGLNRARTALELGHTSEAAEAIRAVRATLDQVAPAQGHDALDQLQQQLSDQLATVDPKAAATLYLPPATTTGSNRAATAAPETAAPAPLTDRAAESGSAPAATTAGSAPASADPVAPAAPAPDPVAAVPPAPVPPPVVPDPVAPDPVAPDPVAPDPVAPPPPDPATSPPGSDTTPVDPVTVPPVVVTTDPPVVTTDPPAPADNTGQGSADVGSSDTGGAAPAPAPADVSGGTADAASGGGSSLTVDLLATVSNAASETANNANAAAGGG